MTDTAHVAAGPKPIPPEIDRWNWGAFLLNWIWGIGNNTFIALLALIPGFGIIMMIVLGAKGSRWAWRNGRWDSVAHFRRVQRRWAIWGLIIWIAVGLFLVSVFGGLLFALKHSDAYRLALAKVEASPAAVAVLGTPITPGLFPGGSIKVVADGTGQAALNFTVSGPKASGTVFLEAIRRNSVWTITRLALKRDGSDELIDLVGGRNNST